MNENEQLQQGKAMIGAARYSAEKREQMVVQASIALATQFPRDEISIRLKIEQSCARKDFAKKAQYSYPRGGGNVVGPSVQLAREIAKHYGHIQTGSSVLERRKESATVMVYAWDVQSNEFEQKVFEVEFVREKKVREGGAEKLITIPLESERDIEERIESMISKKQRNCLFHIIPKHLIEYAVSCCNETLRNDSGKEIPITDRAAELFEYFQKWLGISRIAIEAGMKKKAVDFSEKDIETLRGIYNSITDGSAKFEDFFDESEIKEGIVSKSEESGLLDSFAETNKTKKQEKQNGQES